MTFLQLPTVDLEKIASVDSLARNSFKEKITEFAEMPAEEIFKTLTNNIIEIALKVLLALAIYLIGRWAIKKTKRWLERIFTKRNVDVSLRTFLLSMVNIILYVFLVILVIGVLGIDTTSFIALFASAGLAVGMALSGTLQNFAGGVMLLLLKPYGVGDFIESQGHMGTVKSIQLFHTIINTPDNKTIIIPNGGISNSVVNNYTKEKIRRVDWSVCISYGDDFKMAKAAIIELLEQDERVMKDPACVVFLGELGESCVKLSARAWVKGDDLWNLFFAMNEKLYKVLPTKGVRFPFPQLDVHISNSKNVL